MSVESSSARWPDTVGGPWSRHPPTTILEAVVPLLEAAPTAPAVTFEDGAAISRGDLLTSSAHFAGYLVDRVRPGDRVLLAVENRAEFLIAWLAILACRAVPVIVDPRIGSFDAAHILNDANPVLVIAETDGAALLKSASSAETPATEMIVVKQTEPHGLGEYRGAAGPISLRDVEASVTEPAGIHYTSGTTGPPKGCVHDHLQYPRYVDVYLRLYPFRSSDTVLNVLQFHYGDSLWLWILTLRIDAQFISVRRFSVRRFWGLIDRYGVTTFFSIGAIPSLLLKQQVSALDTDSTVRFALQVGIPATRHEDLIERFGFPWVEAYGLSESGPAICMPFDQVSSHLGTGAIGLPVPEVSVRLAGEQEQEATGELLIRAPTPMLGYLGRPDATSQVLKDGWLHTGDLARRDSSGIYYFLGRIKSIIRRSGENVSPEEVEAVLRLHPGVVDAAVVPVVDDAMGEEIKAYVVLQPDVQLKPRELADFCRTHLSGFKVPRYYEQYERPFPRTASMRIRKSVLTSGGVHQTSTAWDLHAVDD